MSQPKKKFSKLRQWNRRRNYYFKSLRMRIARLLWDDRRQSPFKLDEIKKILLLRDDGKIGDMVVSTLLIREISARGYIIDVLATPENIIVIENNPFIRRIFLNNQKNIENILSEERYDAVIDMGDKIPPKSLRFLKKISAKNNIGFNKEAYNIYNKSIAYNGYDRHITARYSLLMDQLEFVGHSVNYDLHIPQKNLLSVSNYLSSLPGKYNIVINPFTASKERDFSQQQLQELINSLHASYKGLNILLIGLPDRLARISVSNAVVNLNMSINDAMSLIYHCDLVISPDTSVVHIAAAWKKPLVALYGNDMHGMFNNNDVWGPGYREAIQITTADKYSPVSTIPASQVMQAVDSLFLRRE